MKKAPSFASSADYDSDDMYVDDKDAKKPIAENSRKGTGKTTKVLESAPDIEGEENRQKEKHSEGRIHVAKSSRKGTGKMTKGLESAPDMEGQENRQKERHSGDTIHILELEVIKLQLQNNILTAAMTSSG